MGIPSVGDIVTLPFPYSDLSRAKKRPALIVADADYRDVVLCQITSRPYTGTATLALDAKHFIGRALPLRSYLRPDKLFTAARGLISEPIARLTVSRTSDIRAAVAALFVD